MSVGRAGRSASLEEKPMFCDIVENGWASEDNPTRLGYFVRLGKRTGRLNPGEFWEMTDGEGYFWKSTAHGNLKLRIVSRASLKAPAAFERLPENEALGRSLKRPTSISSGATGAEWASVLSL